ncbi:hypothetical protein JAO29_12315 [Edaphobacter sp. HDX4]|uniref:hypothetical protein n=1 Tax=Edaphobacter sp. HDX4 TaxID=2794064 RepID=UPI002FE5E914
MPEVQDSKEERSVEESGLSKVNDELTLGYDRDFEAQWWRIELGLWVFLAIAMILGLTGLSGRGPLAHKQSGTPDGALTVVYERIARYKTPGVMTVRVEPQLYRDGKIYLWLNRAMIERMGLQRIIPQPAVSLPGDDGIGYVFPVSDPTKPTLIFFANEVSSPGIYEEELKTDPQHDLFLRALALP